MFASKTDLLAAVKACREVEQVRVVHASAIRVGQDSDLYVTNSLSSVYGACGCLVQLSLVFDGMRYRSVVSWNVLILGHVNNGNVDSALELYSSMQLEGFIPDAVTLTAAIKACTGMALQAKQREGASLHSVLLRGKALQSHGSTLGLSSHVLVASNLVNLYANCGSLLDARRVFDETFSRRPPLICAWNALLLAYAEKDDGETSLDLFGVLMRDKKVTVNSVTFYAALKACESIASKGKGMLNSARVKHIHLQAKENGFDTEAHVAGILVRVYAACGEMRDAKQVFDKTPWHTTVWNSLIRWHAENGEPEIALEFFSRMQNVEPSAFTYVAVLKAHSTLAVREEKTLINGNLVRLVSHQRAREVHARLERRFEQDVFITSALVSLYAECGSMVDAHRVFEEFQGPESVVMWNALLLGYAENGDGESVFKLFTCMVSNPDAVTYVALSKACTSVPFALQNGKFVHSLVVKNGYEVDFKVANSLIDMHSKCCGLVEAGMLFDSLADHKSVLPWTSLILGYTEKGEPQMALELYEHASMQTVLDSQAFAAALKACSSLAAKEESSRSEMLRRGREIFCQAMKLDKFDSPVAGYFVDLCARCDDMVTAKDIMKETTPQGFSTAAWASIMLSYIDNGQPGLALEVYSSIESSPSYENVALYGAALKACGSLTALKQGLAVQRAVFRRGFESENVLRSSTLDMHFKCGSIVTAQCWFDSLATRDLISWNTLLTGYSRTTKSDSWSRVFELFKCMVDERFEPTAVSFAAILNACSHGGLVETGKGWFAGMNQRYGVVPDKGHYNCMVDILARANRLDEALALTDTIPGGADFKTWTSILGACTKWKNSRVAQVAFKALVSLDEKTACAYSLLANSCSL